MNRSAALAAALLPLCASPAPIQPEDWQAYSRTAQAITGSVRFSPRQITFGNGASLPLQQIEPLPAFKTGIGPGELTLYRVTKPANPVLLQGQGLCGKPVTQIVVTRLKPQPPFIPALLAINVFAGKEDCGLYTYEAGGH